MNDNEKPILENSMGKDNAELSHEELDRVAGGQTIVIGSGPVFEGVDNPLSNNLSGNLVSDYDKTH